MLSYTHTDIPYKYMHTYPYAYGSIYTYGAEHLHYTQFYPFYASSSITIPSIYLPIKVSYLSYYMIVETLKSIHFTFINA